MRFTVSVSADMGVARGRFYIFFELNFDLTAPSISSFWFAASTGPSLVGVKRHWVPHLMHSATVE